MSAIPKVSSPRILQSTQLKETVDQRKTQEIVFAFVGPIASGVTKAAQILSQRLQTEYGYECFYHKVSEIITDSSVSLLKKNRDELVSKKGYERIRSLQEQGNALRNQFGNDYLAKKSVEKILDIRTKRDGFDESKDEPGTPNIARPKSVRHAHIIDAVKHVDEVRLLKQVYGEMFWLIGVFAPEGRRRKRLDESQRPIDSKQIDDLLEHDSHESIPNGQKVRDTFDKADFFIRNDGENDENLSDTVDRYLEIIFDQNVHTPFRDEEAMYKAQAAAANSACLSRQVGAAIYSADGELIGIGWNDVPKYEGGLYTAEDAKQDHRCHKWKDRICHNDKHKGDLFQKIYSLVSSREVELRKQVDSKISGTFVGRDTLGELRDKLLKQVGEAFSDSVLKLDDVGRLSGLDRLIEFSRAVHAEMEAIISVARDGKSGLRGATMYVTTFPCHSCARHIVASGIERVVFIEPYPKSLAKDLHSDSLYLFEAESGGERQVKFEQFQGVAPKNIIKLFKSGLPRKTNGESAYKNRLKSQALPVFRIALDGFATNEIIVVGELHEREKIIP